MRSLSALALLTLCLALVTPAASAAEPRSRGGDRLTPLWSLLLSWWNVGSLPTAGMGMDPLGGSPRSAPSTKAGMIIDPLGGEQEETPPDTEAGMIIDPLG